MLPLLAQWQLVWLSSKGIKGVSDKLLLGYLLGGALGPPESVEAVNGQLTGPYIKMMNLSHDWLTGYLPFILGKIDRVSFGLLSAADLARAGFVEEEPPMLTVKTPKNGVQIPTSRLYLAVPFVGKDVPSISSEFAHPDIVIGLTTLGYRYEGLRIRDFKILLNSLFTKMATDEAGPYHRRKSCQLFAEWVCLAGGKVRGWERLMSNNSLNSKTKVGAKNPKGSKSEVESSSGQKKKKDKNKNKSGQMRQNETQERWLLKQTRVLSVAAEAALAKIKQHALVTDVWDLWPLHLVDIQDEAIVDVLFTLLHKLPHLIQYWLDRYVFPKTCHHQGLKLCANGQCLGGDMLFSRRIGFSGTPSDLLPLELGRCHYETGSDGQMLSYLTSPRICSYETLKKNWSVKEILTKIAQAKPRYHALIDTGALGQPPLLLLSLSLSLSLCMYVCMYVCMCVCVCMFIHVYIIFIYLFLSVSLSSTNH